MLAGLAAEFDIYVRLREPPTHRHRLLSARQRSGDMQPTNTNALTIGTTLCGKYRIEGPIAEGGMSLVLLGRDTSLDERVAIKLLKAEHRLQRDVLARFVREAKTIRRIQSDRCVKVHDVGMDPVHGPFMVMEYLEGLSLRGILDRESRLVTRRASELAMQICEGLAAAHANDCVHRDIKPDNIIVLNRGEVEEVRILDFGISKHSLTGSVLNQDLSLIHTISLMGSPVYMSPEQMRSTSLTDQRTDIWSLGALLFEMLTGRPPFVSESITEVCSMVISDPALLVHALDPSIPEELGLVVDRCLQKDPALRFPDVGELASALMAFAPRRARMSLEQTLGILRTAGIGNGTKGPSQHPPRPDDWNDSTLVLPSAPALPRAVPSLPPSSYSIPAAYSSVSNIAFVTPAAPSVRALAAMPTIVSTARLEEQQKRSSRNTFVALAMASVVVILLVAGAGVRAKTRSAAARMPRVAVTVVAANAAPVARPALNPSAAGDPAQVDAGLTPELAAMPLPVTDPTNTKTSRPATVPSPSKPHTPAAGRTPVQGVAAAPTATSKIRIIDDEESRRPRVID